MAGGMAGGMAPLILNCGNIWRGVFRYIAVEIQQINSPMTGIEQRLFVRLTYRLVTVPTELSKVLILT